MTYMRWMRATVHCCKVFQRRKHTQNDNRKYKGKQVEDGYPRSMQAWGKTKVKVLQEVEAGKRNDAQVLLAGLKECSKTRNLENGKQIHSNARDSGHDSIISVANALINMYSKCGSIMDARRVFDKLKQPTVVSWTALIFGYADNGQGHSALDLFKRMRAEGPPPNSVTLVAALKACTSLAIQGGASRWAECRDRGKELHSFGMKNGCNSDVYVQGTLVDMYAKCGSMGDAREVFDSVVCPDVVSWNVLIMGYADNGQGLTALDLFTRMRNEGPAPNAVTFVAALKACTSLATQGGVTICRDRGKEIYSFALKSGCSSHVHVQSTLVDLYAKCGNMVDAREVFRSMKHPTAVSWNVLILGYVDNEQGGTALELFTRMRCEGPAPDCVTFVAALKACTSLALKEGANRWTEWRDRSREIYSLAVVTGCNSDYVQSALVDMYSKCGSMCDARQAFHNLKHPTVVCWTALMLGYADNGQGRIALNLFKRMRYEGPSPDSVAFVAALKACSSLAKEGANGWAECRESGKEIHKFAKENGCHLDVYVQSTLLDMYAKCGSMADARQVFDSLKHPTVVSWTALISGYADNGQGATALEIFTRMRIEGPEPDSVTVVAALKACISLAVKGASGWAEVRDRGKEIHSFAQKSGCFSDLNVQSILVDMYAKCGSMVDAREVFNSMKHPDVVSWTALILGYAHNAQGQTALDLFSRMRIEGPAPDSVTFGAALKACGLVGALEFGRRIHSEIENRNDSDVFLVNCLVDFYVKCGSLVEALSVFNLHAETRDLVTWTSLLAGFSSCGDNETVFRLFEAMQDAGFQPEGITFLCVLTCCSHAGIVEKGKECFDAMSTKYGILPTIAHYNCMIDMFGRANKLDEAMALLERMPCNATRVTWMTILSACEKWKNVEVGKFAFQSLLNLNDRNAAGYVLMEHIYGSRAMLPEQDFVTEKLNAWKSLEETEVGEVLAEERNRQYLAGE